GMPHFLSARSGSVARPGSEALTETRSLKPSGSTDSPATPVRSHFRPIILLVTCGISLIAAVALGIAALAFHFRDRALADTQRELSNTALILADQSDRAFQALDLVQQSLIDRMQALGIASKEDYKRQMSGVDVHLLLKDKINGLPHVASLALFNAE